MSTEVKAFRLVCIPDPRHIRFKAMTANPIRAARAALAQILRFVSDLKPGSITAGIRYVYVPKQQSGKVRDRLVIYLYLSGEDSGELEAPASILRRGPISKHFTLIEDQLPPLDESLVAACQIVRAYSFVEPLISCDLNADIPGQYFVCSPFEPNEDNDFSNLDRVLDGLVDAAVVDIAVSPADIQQLRNGSTQYLEHVNRINRLWDTPAGPSFRMDPLSEDPRARMESQILTPHRYPDPSATEVYRQYQKIHDGLRSPQLNFHIAVLAHDEANAHLLASTVAESALEEGSYKLVLGNDDSFVESVKNGLESNLIIKGKRPPDGFQQLPAQYHILNQLLNTATVSELGGVFRLPIAASGPFRCANRDTDPPCEPEGDAIPIGVDDIGETGHGNAVRRISLKNLTRHLFLSGIPGSGKTVTLLSLLISLWRKGIPFLHIEPVKTESRALKQLEQSGYLGAANLARALRIYTPGNNTLSPLQINPLQVPEGISIEEHIAMLEPCFQAIMPMSGPLPGILRESLEQVYWKCQAGDVPCIADLLAEAEAVLVAKGYSAATYSDLRGAIETRIGNLTRGEMGRVLQGRRDNPAMKELLRVPSILELERLTQDHACFITLFLLMRLRQELRSMPTANGALRYVLVIDEAHNIVGTNTNAAPSEDFPNPKAYAAEYVSRMLAELRALGVGIVIADQMPSAVASEVVKHPATKVTFQLTHNEDRSIIGASMLFGDTEYEEIARLRPGQAYLFSPGYHYPQRIRTENLHEQLDLSPPSDLALRDLIKQDDWFRVGSERRMEDQAAQLQRAMNAFDDLRTAILREMAGIMARLPVLQHEPHASRMRNEKEALLRKVEGLREPLQSKLLYFENAEYTKWFPTDVERESLNTKLRSWIDHLERRWREVARPDAESALMQLGHLSDRIQALTDVRKGEKKDETKE